MPRGPGSRAPRGRPRGSEQRQRRDRARAGRSERKPRRGLVVSLARSSHESDDLSRPSEGRGRRREGVEQGVDELIGLDDDRFGGYLARKQTHIHKLAMILAAAESDRLVITAEHLALAHTMITDLEPDMQFVFSKIGKSEDSLYIERLIWYVHKRGGCPWTEAYRFVHTYFPKISDFEAVITGAIRAGYLVLQQQGSVMMLLPGANTPDGLDTEGKGP